VDWLQRKLYFNNLTRKEGEIMQEEKFNESSDEETQAEYNEDSFNEESSNGLKQWIQDNLRIILSVIVVIAIAGGIYSYSKRAPEDNTSSDIASQIETEELQNQKENNAEKDNLTEEEKQAEEKAETEKTENSAENNKKKDDTQKVSATETKKVSQETENSFIETAQKGEGLTHLARHALADYLEKNPDSELKAEQKIYIEDYLRKNVGFHKGIHVGTSVEFSKDLIKKAISQAKQLNEKQIKNLHKYVVRVSSLQ